MAQPVEAKIVMGRRVAIVMILFFVSFSSLLILYDQTGFQYRTALTKLNNQIGKRRISFAGLVYAANHTVLFCRLPKVASSVTLMMTKRLNGVPNWNSTIMSDIRNQSTWDLPDAGKSRSKSRDVFDPHIIKAVMVRNPVTRLLSGYLNKIVNIRAYELLPGEWAEKGKEKNPPTFQEFVDLLDSVPINTINKHFRPQSMLCHPDIIPYDYVIQFENRENDTKGFLKSIGHWEDIGASGWGPNGTSAIFAEGEDIVSKNGDIRPSTVTGNPDLVKEYYTPDLLHQVFRMFEKDFNGFKDVKYSREVDSYIDG